MGNANLLGLPTELLVSIFTDTNLSTNDLYALALLSRRLNIVSIPIFLCRMGIPDPESCITLKRVVWSPSFSQESFDALAGLRIATYLTGKSVSCLNCYFQYLESPYDTFQPFGTLYVGVRRLSAFIQRLASVDTVKLYLPCIPQSLSQRKNTSSEGSIRYEARARVWTTAFADLINLVSERGCRSLTVRFENGDPSSYRFYMKDITSAFFSRTKSMVMRHSTSSRRRTLSGTRWGYSATPHSPGIQRLSALAINRCVLTTFCIHSTILLTPPFFSWTLDVLDHSPQLTSLSIGHISFSEEVQATDVWNSVLVQISNITRSKITDLSFLHPCSSLDERDLLVFISRHQQLIKLTVESPSLLYHHGRLEGHLTPPAYPMPCLKHLRVLKASEVMVQYFLRARPPTRIFSRSADDDFHPLPQLQQLVMSPSSILGNSLTFTPLTKDWNTLLSQFDYPRRSTPITFGLNIRIAILLSQKFMAAHLESIAANSNANDSDNFKLHRISEVSFHRYIDNTWGGDDNANLLSRWLAALFPDLCSVAFTHYPGTAVLEGTVSLPWDIIRALMDAFSKHCPMVNRLVVPGGNFTKLSDVWVKI